MKTIKNRIVISDLATSNSEFNFGLSTSFGVLTSRAHYFTEYSSDEDTIGEDGASAHTEEFLASEAERQEKLVSIKANNILESEEEFAASLDPEVLKLYAEQKLDLEEAGNAYSNSKDQSVVTIKVQRKSENGHWYNVSDKVTKEAITFVGDIGDLYLLTEEGTPYSSKTLVVTEKALNEKNKVVSIQVHMDAVEAIMKKRGFGSVHNYSYVDQESGEMVFKSQEQRFRVTSPALKAGVVLDGVRLESTVGSFFNKYDVDANEVYSAISYYGNENEVEFGSCTVVIPSSQDESNGDAATNEYNEGIIYGRAEATTAMMSDDMANEDIAAQKREEARIALEGSKARRASFTKKDIKELDDKELLKSDLGVFVASIVDATWLAMKDAKLQNEVNSKLKAYESQAAELDKVLQAYKRVNGKAFAYVSYKNVQAMVINNKNKAFAEQVESHILENIANINNGSLTVADLDPESLIEIRETSVKFGKKSKACWIVDPAVSNAIKLKYATIKNVKVA